MATVAAVYTVAPFARTAEQVGGGLAGQSDPDAPKRPRPENKRVWASLVKPADEVLEQAFAEAESRDLDRRKKWVALVDGNEDQLHTLHLLAAARDLNLTIILDLIHVCEYMWKASLCFHTEDDPPREGWVQERGPPDLGGEAS